jgi:type IV secretion system protein VirB4
MEEQTALVERVLRGFGPQLLGNASSGGRTLVRAGRVPRLPGQRPLAAGADDAGPLYRTLPDTRLSFGGDKLELRHGDERRYAALVDIREYADAVEPGVLNALLYEPASSSRRRASRSCRAARPCARWSCSATS